MNFLQKLFSRKKGLRFFDPKKIWRVNTRTLEYNFNFNTADQIVMAYENCPQLWAIINYSARVFSDNRYKIISKTRSGKEREVKENQLFDILNNPHPLLSKTEFWQSAYTQYQLFGAAYILKIKPIGMNVSGLFVIPNQNTEIILKPGLSFEDLIYAKYVNEIIDYYRITIGSKIIDIVPDDILMILNTSFDFSSNYELKVLSPVTTLKQPINNILSQYKSRNTIVDKRGAFGILSNNDKSQAGTIPLDPNDKENLQNEYKRYGLSGQDFQILMTNANVKWQAMNMPIRELELFTGLKNDKIAICDTYQFPILLLNELEGSTFSNMDTAEQILYTKKIIPDWNVFASAFNRDADLGLFQNNYEFIFETDFIDVLQEDRLQNIEIAEKETQIIINLSNSIADGSMTIETAKQTLILILRKTEEVADKLISSVITVQPQQSINNTLNGAMPNE